MTTTTIAEIGRHDGQEVRLRGWVYGTRGSKRVKFLLLRDGTGILQCVLGVEEAAEETLQAFQELTQESSLAVTGTVRADPRSPGGYELALTGIEPIHIARDYPISRKEHGVEFLMDHRHLWLRSRKQHAIQRIRHTVVKAIRDFLDEGGFTLIDAPIFTPAACEGTTTLFETRYFDQSAYLSQSGQLYQEAGAMAHGRCYCFGPTFRAEKSKTRKHLIEFWMVEPEVAFARLDDVMVLIEEFITAIVQQVLADRRPELEVLERPIGPLEQVKPPFPRISYTEAVEMIQRKKVQDQGAPFQWGSDFGAPHEEAVADEFDRPVLVHRFPADIKAFYMEPDPADPKLALGCDLLAPEGYGELVGGGERMSSLELLEQRLEEHGLPKESFQWYLDLRRYGSVPHGGFGMGLERAVAWICKLDHIRESIPFPRMLYRLGP